MKKILLFILCFINLALLSANAENFYIKNYSVGVKVSEKKLLKVTEYIDAYFTKNSHGIIRSIPIKNNIERADETSFVGYAKIYNIKVSEQYSTLRTNNDLEIKIGNPNNYVKEDHTYRIEYDYQLPKTNDEEKDEFYYNIIGGQWDTTIENVYFKIEMPKDFPYDNTGISIGTYGTKGFENRAIFEINPQTNTISGYTTKKLEPNEAITLRIELPPDYFTAKNTGKNPYNKYIAIIMSITLAFAMYFMWHVIGKDNKAIPVVCFNPPKGASSAEVGVMYKDYADTKEIVSLIIYLASKGYLRINNFKDSFTIEKIKDYDGKKTIEKELMDSLFPCGSGNTVSETELKYSKTFYRHCELLSEKLTNGIAKYIFDASSISKSTAAITTLLLSGTAILYLWVLCEYEPFELSIPLIIMDLFYVMSLYIVTQIIHKGFWPRIVMLIFTLSGLPIFLVTLAQNQIALNSNNMSAAVSCIIAIFTGFICSYEMRKRNKLGNKLLGEILGFKKFLKTAEASRIEMLVKENPMYCYDILPYAYVLGVTKQWIENFEKIINYKPLWYSGNFNYHSVKRLTRGLYNLTRPSYENGGIRRSSSSSGGGGFAGGGFGGGGGRSW